MREEKKYLVDEISSYLDKSSYFFLTNYESITVEETNTLREQLNKFDAEFHVVKNRMLKVAVEKQDYPDLSQWLTGPTAIISGGNNPPGIAKTIENFFKETEKVSVKGGVLEKKSLSAEQVGELAKLPSIEVIKAQLMGLLQTNAQRMVTVLQGVPQSLINVLNAKTKTEA